MADKPKYYITTAIAYTSGKPHIGNTYEIVLADAIARYKRSQGYDVFFQTGTDEHGQKIELKAEEAGVTPKEFVDNVSGEIKRIWDLMNTSYDKFIRTTDDYHEKQVQKIFKKLYDQGDIYKGHYEGMYCTPCESFFTESQLVDGKCPDCGREIPLFGSDDAVDSTNVPVLERVPLDPNVAKACDAGALAQADVDYLKKTAQILTDSFGGKESK